MKKFFDSFFNIFQYQVLVVGGALSGMFLIRGLEAQCFREIASGIIILVVYLVWAALLSNRKG